MRSSIFKVFLAVSLAGLVGAAPARSEVNSNKKVLEKQSTYRGWDFLVNKLRADGLEEHTLKRIFQDPRMPRFEVVYFSLKPREPRNIYRGFLSAKSYRLGADFLNRHAYFFAETERRFGVDRYLITSVLLIESHFGQFTGKDLVINRLSRLASLAEPRNLIMNFRKLRDEDPTVTFEAVKARAEHLEKTFYPEIPALIEIAKKNRVDVLKIKGSSAGAFGIPQFLPSSYLRFGLDGNQDQVVSLYSEADAIWSTANFFSNMGWRNELNTDERKKVVWYYNHSEPYVDTVIELARRLEEADAPPSILHHRR